MMRGPQLERLGAGIDALLKSNRFYEARLHPVCTWGDFERLPLTTKGEITADQQANPPFGTNLTFAIDRYTRLHQTSASDIRIAVHAGEPGGSAPAARDLIKRSFGARCFDHTGVNELGPTGVSCTARDGGYLIEGHDPQPAHGYRDGPGARKQSTGNNEIPSWSGGLHLSILTANKLAGARVSSASSAEPDIE